MEYPKCPHCGHQFDAEEIWHTGSTDFPTQTDGEESQTHCLSCKSPLKVVLSLEPSWKFVDEDAEEISPNIGE